MTDSKPSPERVKALKAAMQRQQRETEKRGLPSERIDAEALLILQRYACKCGCGKPLDLVSEWNPESPPPGYPVVAHEFYRRGKQSPGHTLGNVWWWRHECNAREAAKENVARGRGQRLEVRKPEPVCADTDGAERRNERGSPAVSRLSKKHPGYVKKEWRK